MIALFSMAALMALATSWAAYGTLATEQAGEWFIAFAMCLLALQKLKDVDGFAARFLNYDLLPYVGFPAPLSVKPMGVRIEH